METLDDLARKNKRWLRWASIIIILGLLISAFAPYLLTRDWGFISFNNTGDIGDTIGGISGTIVGFVSAVLVYLAFNAQIDANRIVSEQFVTQKTDEALSKNFSNLLMLVSKLELEINSFQIEDAKRHYRGFPSRNAEFQVQTVHLTGLSAFESTLQNYLNREEVNEDLLMQNPKLAEVAYIIELFIKIVGVAKNTSLLPDDKALVFMLLDHLFRAKINFAFDKMTIGMSEDTIDELTSQNLFFQKRNQIEALLIMFKNDIKIK